MSALPLQTRPVTLADGTALHVHTAGPEGGEVVVLLHGAGADHARLSWGETVPVLVALGYRVHAPDLPGYGASPLPEWPVTLPNLVRAVQEWLTLENLTQAVFCGVSMGGGLALSLALACPERVRALVLVGPYGIQRRAPAHWLSYSMVRLPGFEKLNGLVGRSPSLLHASLRSILRNPEAITPALRREVEKALRNTASHRAWNQFQRFEIGRRGLTTNLLPRLADIPVPVLFIQGEADVGVPVQDARHAARLFPDAEFHVLPGAGHWTQRDAAPEFHFLLARFLGRLGGNSPGGAG